MTDTWERVMTGQHRECQIDPGGTRNMAVTGAQMPQMLANKELRGEGGRMATFAQPEPLYPR